MILESWLSNRDRIMYQKTYFSNHVLYLVSYNKIHDKKNNMHGDLLKLKGTILSFNLTAKLFFFFGETKGLTQPKTN